MIFIDLDDFLIGWAPMGDGPCHQVVFPDKTTYTFAIRESAHSFLKELSELAPVRIMTSGTKRYAAAVNAQCQFVPEDAIIAREDFMEQVLDLRDPSGMGTTWALTAKDLCPSGILIDHQRLPDHITGLKMEALGIPPENYIQAPHFCPWRDDMLTPERIKEIIQEIKAILS